MTYATACAENAGTLEYYLFIEGIKYVLSTTSDDPPAGDSWFHSENLVTLQGLRAGTLQRSCRARPGEVWPDVRSMDVEFEDPENVLTAHLRAIEACQVTRLTATLSSSSVTVNVETTTGYASAGELYLDLETIHYTGITATSFTGCTRAYFGSRAREHVFDEHCYPASRPEVSDGPVTLRGRRCVIYAAERVNGVVSATEQIWVGYVDGFEEVRGHVVRIPVGHAIKAFSEGLVYSYVPTGRLRGLYVPNYEGLRYGRLRFYPDTGAGGGWATVDVVTDGSAQFFESAEELIEAAQAAVEAGTTDWHMGRLPDGRVFFSYTGAAAHPIVDWVHTLFEPLGFWGGGELGPGPCQVVARDLPATWFVALLGTTGATGYRPRLYLRTGEASWFVESCCRIEGISAEEGAFLIASITAISTLDDYLVVECGTNTDLFGSVLIAPEAVYGAGPPPSVRQVWVLANTPLHEAMRLLWAGQTYEGGDPLGYAVPERWLAEPCLADGDVDWTQLEALVSASPGAVARVHFAITEPRETGEIVCGALLACSIYAYVQCDGTVGWARARVPATGEAGAALDGSYIDGKRCIDAETAFSREGLVNVVDLVLASGVNTGVVDRRRALLVDQTSLQRYGGKPARDMKDPIARLSKRATEMIVWVPGHAIYASDPIETEMGRHLGTTLFPLLSRPRPVVRLPTTPKARALEINEAVVLTTRWAHDRATGTPGVTGKVALVVGWERQEGAAPATDWMELVLVDDAAGRIAPAAKATSWNAGTSTLTFAATDLYAQDTDTDLDHFEAGDKVIGEEYDSETPGSFTAEVVSVDPVAKTMVLQSVAGSVVVPCIVKFQPYTSCTVAQQGEGWIWTSDDADGQVQNAREGYRWG